jgi:glycosyltransferase involved in cell wall biosynthesis
MKPGPKVALVAVELGRIRRGFERTFSELFAAIRNDLDVTLFKAGGTCGPREKIPALLNPATAIARALPLGRLAGQGEYRDYKRDCLAFASTLLPELVRGRFDVIHTIDPPFAKVLGRLHPMFCPRTRLLFTEGCVMPLEAYPRCAHVHHVGAVTFAEAARMGFPESRMTLVPCGVHTARFAQPYRRAELRKKYGISDKTFVILVVSAVKRLQKRVDYIIEEVSKMQGDFLLWIDGNPEDPTVVELAQSRLGPKQRITHVPTADVPELYHCADVMVHGALSEAFGLAVIEAISSGVMVLTHNAPHFQWLLQDPECMLDMSQPGALFSRLQELAGHREGLASRAHERAEGARQRFDWQSVKPHYLDMYRRVAALN